MHRRDGSIGKETEFQEEDAFPKTLRLTLGNEKNQLFGFHPHHPVIVRGKTGHHNLEKCAVGAGRDGGL